MKVTVDGVERDADVVEGELVFRPPFILPKGDHVISYNYQEFVSQLPEDER